MDNTNSSIEANNEHPLDTSPLPQVTLLLENPRKSNNWGPLLRCCAAFGISQIFVVGVDKCNSQGSHGASKHVELLAFPTHDAALAALKGLGFVLYGVLHGVPNTNYQEQCLVKKSVTLTNQNNQKQKVQERVEVTFSKDDGNDSKSTENSRSLPKSVPVHLRPFADRTCLVLEKTTKGLSWDLARHCKKFVHVPHQGLPSNDDRIDCGRSWLSVEASLSIILHEFTAWAGYNKMTNYQGQKYHVKHINKGSGENAANKHEERRKKRESQAQESVQGCGINFLGSEDKDNGDY